MSIWQWLGYVETRNAQVVQPGAIRMAMDGCGQRQDGERFRRCNRLILLAVLLLGFAHVAFLPPFEGFDEPAHLSYIQQIADTGTIPLFGTARISTDVAGYSGPASYATRNPPFDENGPRATYRRYFAMQLPALPAHVARAFMPGRGDNVDNGDNYEAQHPPLYYIALTPFYRLANDWSWQDLLLLLRSVSWTIAFAGFAIGCRATQSWLAARGATAGAMLAMAVWPLLFPEFFPEMARLGNDCLCLLLAGLAWKLLLDLLQKPGARLSALLGLVLGLGLLTKAFFLPITAGAAATLFYAAWQQRDRRLLLDAGLMLLVASLIGSGWYIHEFVRTGVFTGSYDLITNSQQGSLFSRMGNFSLYAFLHGIAVTFGTFAWAGTRSFGRLPDIFTLPVVILLLLPLFDWLRSLLQRRNGIAMAPLFVAGAMFGGMMFHMLNQITVVPPGPGSAGYYFHILAGPIGLAFALGWQRPRILGALVIYALLFHGVTWFTQLSMFSGCAFLAGSYRYLQFDPMSCLIDPARLAILAEPWLGAILLAAALTAGALALINRPRAMVR